MASAYCEPITGVSGKSRQRGPGGDPLVRVSGGLNAFLLYQNLRSRPICPEICFCRTKKFRRTFGASHGSADPPLDPPVSTDSWRLKADCSS